MNATRDPESILNAWLDEGPTDLPDATRRAILTALPTTAKARRGPFAPWRFSLMNTTTRLAAAAIVAVIAIGGAIYLVGQRPGVGGPSATPAPTPSSAVGASAGPTAHAPVVIPTLSETFASPLNGYTVRHPAGWTVTPASAPWVGAGVPWGNPALDDLRGSDVRFVGTSQALQAGQTPDAWIAARTGGQACNGSSMLPAQVSVGSATGTVTLNGCAAQGGIATGGAVYDVVVVVENRGYDFTVDGNVDAPYVQAMLGPVIFQPGLAVNPSPAPS